MFGFLSHYKTTLAGLSAIIGGVTLLANGQVVEGLTSIVTGIGLLTAADAKKGV